MSQQPIDTQTDLSTIDSMLNTVTEKYLADSKFIVSGTNTGYLTAGFDALAPYANLTNRYYPTVAVLPNVGSNLKTRGQLGGYFVPSNLGATTYLTKDIIYSLSASNILPGVSYTIISPSIYNKGRGLTLNDQSDGLVIHLVDTDWMKATNSGQVFNGNLAFTDTIQKFIPYHSHYESTHDDSSGVVNARDDFEFWTGTQKQTWNVTNSATQLDSKNYFNLAGRIQSLILTPDQELYSWNTDIFGNQYALYKPIITPTCLYASASSIGTLYVRTVDGTINVAPITLKQIYDKYIGNTIYNQLTANNIVNFEVFFDTFVIQLSSTVLYEKISYNYESYQIERALQNFLPLAYTPISNIEGNQTLSNGIFTNALKNAYNGVLGTSAVTYYGGNWYDATDKTITICTLLSSTLSANSLSTLGAGVSSLVVPVLYTLDLNNPRSKVRIYPNESTSYSEYIYPLKGNSGIGITYMEEPVFTYNEDTNLYITTFISFSGDDNNIAKYGPANQQLNLISYKIKA